MPYIVMKRNDIPDGVLQVLDLVPNTSLRNSIYDPQGQTKYVRAVQNDIPTVQSPGGVFTLTNEVKGLSGWFLTNVTDGTGVVATGTVTVAGVLALDTFTIPTTPAFVLTATAAPRVSGGLTFQNTAGAGTNILSATSMVAAINDTANWTAAGATKTVTASNVGGTSAIVTLTANAEGVAYNYVLVSSTGVRLAVVGMAAGADADALTAAEAIASATAVLGRLKYGNNAVASLSLTLAAINGVLIAPIAITAGQLPDVLDILAGREYVVPNGVQIQAASAFGVVPAIGAAGGPSWTAGTLRNIYDSNSLKSSFIEGMLAGYRSAAFNYLDTQAVGLAVYNDDGSLYV